MSSPNISASIIFGDELIAFRVSKTYRIKTVSLSVGYDGIRVLAPNDMSEENVYSVVRSKAPWLLKKQAEYRELGGHSVVREFISGETTYYLGRPHKIAVIYDKEVKIAHIKVRGSTLVATIMPGLSAFIQRTSIRGALKAWYQSKAKALFKSRAKLLSNKLDIDIPVIKVVDQSKRWGSCDARGHIRLNWRLIMAPISSIEYVIAHELCHLIQHNHSPAFWRHLEIIMPDYADRARALDRSGHKYMW